MNRTYQLVLQWPASMVADPDDVVALEDLLRRNLSDDSHVDGHDFGSGEMNIFIRTNVPQRTFDSARQILQREPLWPQVRAAYRRIDGEDYTILWPADLTMFRII